jgi:undecaprenyl-diphosphatase
MRLSSVSRSLTVIFSPIFREIGILLALLVVVAGTWIFLEIADEIIEGGTQKFDLMALEILRAYHPPWLSPVLRDITSLGSLSVLFLVTASVAGFLLLQRDFRHMIFIIVSTGFGALLVILLKTVFARQRPDILLPVLLKETTPGFPSGHATMAAVVYLSIAAVLSRVEHSQKVRVYTILLAVLLTFLVGMTRVCLGVHYITDILAGWSIGFAWACLCWLFVRYLDVRKNI